MGGIEGDSDGGWKVDPELMEMMDELVQNSDGDEELKRGVQWMDDRAKEWGISFYEMFYICIHRSITQDKAREWLQSK